MSTEGKRKAFGHYEAAWNERDADKRAAELDLAWADDGVYLDDDVPEGVTGRAALSEYIALEHAQEPGLVISASRELVILADRGWMQWEARSATGATRASGTDFVEFAPDDRIARLTDFLDTES